MLTDVLAGHPRYVQVKYLNRGAYGFVLQALDKDTGNYVALKFVERGGKVDKYVEREILNHQRLLHPHIIGLQEVFLTEEYLVLVLEYAAGGDLYSHMAQHGALSEDAARWFFQQIMLAIDYCHKMGVANRDIKLENMLLLSTSPHPLVKLSDFGFSKDENCHSAPGSCVGTPSYLAPEIICNVHGQSYDGKAADVWSCGVLLYVMLTNSYPFGHVADPTQPDGDKRLIRAMQAILKAQYSFPASPSLSDSCKGLISGMLVPEPGRRLSVDQVLHHPWCCHGMQGALLGFNDQLVARSSVRSGHDSEVLEQVSSIVREARLAPAHLLPLQGSQHANAPVDEFLGLDWSEFDVDWGEHFDANVR